MDIMGDAPDRSASGNTGKNYISDPVWKISYITLSNAEPRFMFVFFNSKSGVLFDTMGIGPWKNAERSKAGRLHRLYLRDVRLSAAVLRKRLPGAKILQ
jgi:hypothetical protein